MIKNGIENFRKRDLINKKDNFISLTHEQIEMLEMSEQDIEFGKLVTEQELEKTDKKWLK
ncbi:hypothetical protein SAMN05444280_10617 [Tangfeifania diversioriginum]|uniref:Uncharacterized protein n=1 Tax=Tangfeifania diversioriginum TaxID=1168035 RepID=A0A1M6E1C2_9BACT|nr:hypothetical protein [Tangfeifania diversioriginum]SHI79170.1 hypothetical protein SAMN05444280_10617 [Tangfeifania diversioriginum]